MSHIIWAMDTETDEALEDPADLPDSADGLIEDDLLVEEISIDGMCGVY